MADFLTSLVGSKPVVPNIPVVSLPTMQQQAIAANQAALPGAKSLASSANLFNIDQINKMLQQSIPGYGDITGNVAKNIQSLTAGQIPGDVQDAVTRGAAGRALSGGYGGTEAGNNLVARDLGLTSLELTQQGLSSAQSWMKTMDSLYAPGMMNLTSMFITPEQQYQATNQQNQQQFQQQWMQNQIDAMPAPWAEDLKQFVYRAMSAYSGTSVAPNPYSTPGSFGSGIGGGGGGGSTGGGGGGLGGDMYGGPAESAINYNAPGPTDSGGGDVAGLLGL